MVEIGRFATHVEANLARLLLESHGLDVLLLDAQMNNFFGGAMIPVRLLVVPDDVPQAVAILTEDGKP